LTAHKPNVKKDIIKWATDTGNSTGIRREHRYRDKRIKKKEDMIEYLNREYLETHKNITIRVEMDEMWSLYQDKKHQIRLWWAIDHGSGEAIAFWFGRREHENLDTLPELLKPLTIGTVYSDGNYAYYERLSPEVPVVMKRNTQKVERKHPSLRTWSARLERKGIRFSKTARMHKIVVALIITIWFFGRVCLIQ
jgi:insertion element IS1 protein InsB